MKDFNCLLVHTPRLQRKDNTVISLVNYSAMGLFSLAGELVKNGFDTKILHLGIEKYLNRNFLLSEYVKENNIKFIAFTLQWYHQSYDVIETTRILKEKCPGIKISLGGLTSSFFAQEIMEKYPHIDFIIKGDGEVPIVKLAEALCNNTSFDNIPNLYYRSNNEIIFNGTGFIATSENISSYEFFNSDRMLHFEQYSKIDYSLDFSKDNQLVTPTSCIVICLGRGCLGKCIWCGGSYEAGKIISGRTVIAYRNIDHIISEIKTMHEKFNIFTFRFGFDPDDNNRSYFIKLFKKLGLYNNNLNIMFDMEGLPDKQLLDVYKASVSADSVLSITPTCADENLRKKYRDFFFTNEQLEQTLDYMEELKIKSEIYFSRVPGVSKKENNHSEQYAKYLEQKYKYITFAYTFDLEIVPASMWSITPKKYKLTNARNSFDDYYNLTKDVEKSFENTEIFKTLQ